MTDLGWGVYEYDGRLWEWWPNIGGAPDDPAFEWIERGPVRTG